MENPPQQPPSSAVPDLKNTNKTAELDSPLHTIGFEIDELSPSCVSGHLVVTPKCCQPFKVLHGGVSALISEALASIGAYLACGMKRVAGIHLSIDHMRSAQVGDLVFAQATPLSSGRTIQVWEVRLWNADETSMKKDHIISSARVTLVCNLPVPNHLKEASKPFRKYAKL
ncbi:1,4-dihydroxy-2-naphthoyl-CoA thioesterase 1-like [Chenopodium quinoa]|uniref:1,4-dihydroxy-2-naphthoyl-CoA thioesterase 1-like n=1 Tax=Chenopodium quinoa TaxID=63459 RepID=UPI000B77A191|nr:1,4-dihydroxy-2-naphthoyl-CoA thioesterase 1-like [Chenopodium quinoa]